MSAQTRKRPAATGRGFGKLRIDFAKKPNTSGRLPANWRERLPDPASYYARHVEKLSRPNALGWAQGRCPFHDDHNASLSVQLAGDRGAWRCFASCGGGDMIGFHTKLTGRTFVEAVRDLLRGAP